ncbi:MAG: hypothetical protein NVS1B2_02960 [Vulcanimicrobiaceae bacterium]
MTGDRLAFVREAPGFVERVVRVAARGCVDARCHDRSLDLRDVANVALGELDRALASERVRLDRVGRHELAEATMAAATTFARSPLARRLARVPSARFRPTPRGADAALVDRFGRLHLIRIEAFAGDAERVACARTIVADRPTDRTTLHVPTVHLFSLRDGKLRSFAPPAASVPVRRDARRAA